MTAQALSFGPFTFRRAERMLEARGRPVRLGSRAAAILNRLLDQPGELVDHRTLQAAVWGGMHVDESALRVHMSNLRRLLIAEDDSAPYIANEPGRGYRFVANVAPHDGLTGRPRLSRPDMPGRLDTIHGRSAIIGDLEGRLAAHRFLSIVGPGGIGKSAVALAIVAKAEARGTRSYCVDFASVDSEHLVMHAATDALRRDGTTLDPIRAIQTTLGDDDALLVLDNCEHLVGAVADLAERLLTSAPRLRLLVTSQEPLRASGEWVYRLGPLSIPCGKVGVEEALGYDSVQLFVERAKATLSDFEIKARNVESICEICRQLDGIPLAITLAAAQVDVMEPTALADRLDDRLDILKAGRRTGLARHRTLRATMDWSFGLLDADCRSFLQRLSVLPGSFDLAAACAVADPHADECAALEIIAKLRAKSLLLTESNGGQTRYRMFETVRRYAAELLLADVRRASPPDIHTLLPSEMGGYGHLKPPQPRIAIKTVTAAERVRDDRRAVI